MPTGACASILPLGRASAIRFKVARFRTTTKRHGSFAHADGAAHGRTQKIGHQLVGKRGADWYSRMLRRPKMKDNLSSVFISRLPQRQEELRASRGQTEVRLYLLRRGRGHGDLGTPKLDSCCPRRPGSDPRPGEAARAR